MIKSDINYGIFRKIHLNYHGHDIRQSIDDIESVRSWLVKYTNKEDFILMINCMIVDFNTKITQRYKIDAVIDDNGYINFPSKRDSILFKVCLE